MYIVENNRTETPLKHAKVELWFVRHGETIFNKKGLVQGWCDSPLTTAGQLMSASLGNGFKNMGVSFDAIYSSDLTRCAETSKIIKKSMKSKLKIRFDRRLREINTGDGEGELIVNHLKNYPYSLHFKKHPGTPNGETWDDVYARLIPVLNEICEDNQEGSDSGIKRVLVVAHSMIIASIVGYLDRTQEEVMSISNNSVTVFKYDGGELRLDKLNDTSYIDNGLSASENKELAI